VNTLKDEDLPTLDDEFVKTLGNFADVAAFEANVRENIGKEKQLREEEKRRATMLDALIKETKVMVPDVMARGEARRIEAEFVHMLQQNGTTLDGYLQHIKKSREDVEKEWLDEGRKRAVLQLAINNIAKQESIQPDAASVEKEVAHLQEHYKDAHEHDLRAFVETQEQNKAVIMFLESLGK
jgi:trigger factor